MMRPLMLRGLLVIMTLVVALHLMSIPAPPLLLVAQQLTRQIIALPSLLLRHQSLLVALVPSIGV